MKTIKENINDLNPSKEIVDKILNKMLIFDIVERDAFNKGVIFAKGFLHEDTVHFQKLIENKEAYINHLELKNDS